MLLATHRSSAAVQTGQSCPFRIVVSLKGEGKGTGKSGATQPEFSSSHIPDPTSCVSIIRVGMALCTLDPETKAVARGTQLDMV